MASTANECYSSGKMFWTPKSNANIHEMEILVKIEATRTEINKIHAEAESVQDVMDLIGAQISTLEENKRFIRGPAKIVSLNEVKSINAHLVALKAKEQLAERRMDELAQSYEKCMKYIEELEIKMAAVKFKVLEFKKKWVKLKILN